MNYDPKIAFENIEEIKFTRVGENTFSVTIKSDITINNELINNTIFKSELVQLDSTLELKCNREYTWVKLSGNPASPTIKSEYYNIPMNIKLLLNQELNEFFNIRKED